MTHKVALVPSEFFDENSARHILSETAALEEGDRVSYVNVPEFSAVLVYAADGQELPEMYHLLMNLRETKEHNRIAASYADGWLHLAIARGDELLLSNVFQAADFTTAEYFLLLAMKKLQLNPEISTVRFRTPLSEEEEMSLYRYFKSVEKA